MPYSLQIYFFSFKWLLVNKKRVDLQAISRQATEKEMNARQNVDDSHHTIAKWIPWITYSHITVSPTTYYVLVAHIETDFVFFLWGRGMISFS